MQTSKFKIHAKLYLSEFIGTGLLVLIGLSIVIFNWGEGSITARYIPSAPARRLLSGFLFGCTGCIISLSPVGKISGAHINPAVSYAFWLRGKMRTKVMLGYVISQMLGAVAGCLPLLFWGKQGASVNYGNTIPGQAGVFAAYAGETITTMMLIIVVFFFVGNKALRNYTPYAMPLLYCLMVWAEAPLSGCSTNPARSFGPAVISNVYTAFWLYIAAPLTGVLIVVAIFKWLRLRHYSFIEAARMAYHDRQSPKALMSKQ